VDNWKIEIEAFGFPGETRW